jgi:outer membrane receptor protein involved in Fe transport
MPELNSSSPRTHLIMNIPLKDLPHALRRALRAGSALVLTLGCAVPMMHAQTAPATSDGASSAVGSQDVTVLSPFVVDASEDHGYKATNTLAGTRLRTSLKDVASPVSVFTPELLKNIGATNMQDALMYSVNVENENEFAPDDTEGESVASTNQNRVRGLAVGTPTRGFFKTNFRADTYNTERLTVASGPNAILFGIGSPAGTIDATPFTANPARTMTSASVRFDNNGSLRATIDLNLPVIKDTLAVRAAVLSQEEKTFRKPELDNEKRQFFTATYKPFPGTTVRGSFERLTDSRIRAWQTLMTDHVSDWIKLGKPLYNMVTSTWTFDNGKTWVSRPDLASWVNKGGIGFNDRVFIAQGNKGGPETQGFDWENTGVSYNQNELYSKTFSDDSVVNSKVNLFGRGDRTQLTGEDKNFVVEQRITKDLYAEVAYNNETNHRFQTDPFRLGLSSLQADVNWYLPDPVDPTTGKVVPGTPVKNPNVGRYFIDSEYLGYNQELDYETKRGMLSYTHDFTEENLKQLGRYNVGVMWQRETTDNFKVKERMMNAGSYWIGKSDNYGPNNVRSRAYLDIPGLGGDSAAVQYAGDFQQPSWPTVVGGMAGDGTPSRSLTEVTGKLLVAQGYLLNDSLVLTYGYRDDREKVYNATYSAHDPNTGLFVTRGIGFPSSPDSIQEGITRTYGVVYHTPLKGVSLLYNRSNAFNPQGTFHDYYNNPLPPGTGVGEDYGLTFDLLDHKLSARIERYTNTSKDNVEYDWFYEAPKWGVASMDDGWGMVTTYAKRLGNLKDIQETVTGDNLRATRDFKSQGYEGELTWNATSQLDLRLTVAQTTATNTRVVPLLQQYVAARLPVWEKYYGYPAWHQWDATMPAWNADWRNDPNSTGYGVINGLLPTIQNFKALEGAKTTRGRTWRGNLVANYRFEGALRGLSAGGAARWRSPDTIGYYGQANPLNPTGPQMADVSRPIHGDSELFFDGWAGYERPLKLGSKTVNWSVQLNVRNLLDNNKVTAIAAYFDGTRTAYVRNEPISFSLTNTIKF